nr:phosphotransferase family protein [Sphingomonas sp. CDS-1]
MNSIDEQAATAYLAQRLGASVQLVKMRRTFPGASRETYLVDLLIKDEPHSFALRVDPPNEGYGCPFPLRHEWEVYSRLWRSDVPVPEPLWFDENQDFAEGRPHMVRRLVEGSTAIPGLYDQDAEGERLRRRVAFECAEKLALVHSTDWKALGFDQFIDPPASPAEANLHELDYWYARWCEKRPYASPMVEEAFAWLRENVPTDAPRISIIKGNNGVGEELWRDGRIVAMCDWELTGLSDGALDLAFSQGTLSLSDFHEVMAHYGACVGAEVSPHRLAYAHFFIWLKQHVLGSCYLYGVWAEGRRKEAYMLSFGLVTTAFTGRYVGRCIGRDLVEAFAEVSGRESSYYRGID